jgi:type IV secretion system protein VirB10
MGLKPSGTSGADEEHIAERGVASMARVRSLQSRLSSALAMLLCSGIGVGLLLWYYGGILSHHRASIGAAQKSTAPPAAESALPPLGPIQDPRSVVAGSVPLPLPPPPTAPTALPQPSLVAAELAPAPTTAVGQTAAASPPRQSALERRMSGPAFTGSTMGTLAPVGSSSSQSVDATDHGGTLAGLLIPTATPAARASELPVERLLLAKGAFIDCTLETAIDSSLPGMTTCITATDTFSVDGKVVLLERGSKLIGETRGQVQQGSARLFVLWTEARTPTGVVVPLASPGTDALGRSGLDGEVDRHFWERFGAAILISLVDGAAQAAQRSGGSGTIIYDSSSSRDVATEALRGTIGIAPTITKHQGDRIQILVARDLDFRQVYQLRDTESVHQQ